MKATRLFVVRQEANFVAKLGTISRKSYEDNNSKELDYKAFDIVVGDYVQAISEQGHQDFLRFDDKNLRHFKIK